MKNTTARKAINLTLSLLMMLAMTAFLFTQIAKAEAYVIPQDEIADEIQEEETTTPTKSLDESEDLLSDYIEVLSEEYAQDYDSVSFKAKNGIIANKTRGSKLTGAEKKAYDYLKLCIEAVAKGETEEGLTVFDLDFGDMYSEEEMNARYSAEDLGVNEVFVFDEEAGTGYITDEAKTAVVEKYTLDTSKVINALLCDFPYTLFWFDKTVGMYTQKSCSVGCEWIGGEDGEYKVFCRPAESKYTFNFAVSEDYIPDPYYYKVFPDGYYRPIQTDTEVIENIGSAVTNAMEVVENAPDSSDYEKLDYYRDWICDEVSYNDYAMDNDQAYGNPWQLIYAFDNDEDTNIVCEGYSKAFKYLCDLTEDFEGDIDCRLVTGDMTGGTGAGPHMWNIVEIGNKNYLVDVTNCDEGTVGAPKELFLVGNENVEEVQITEDGKTAEKYTFDKLNPVISYTYDKETVDTYETTERLLYSKDYGACEHPNVEIIEAVEATCIKAGNTAGKKCSICNSVIEGCEYIAPLGHDYQDVPGTAIEATCKKAGRTADKKCSRCEDLIAGTEIPIKEHSWNQIETVAPTIDADGSITYRCSGCGDEKTEEIPKLIPIDVPKAKTLTYNGKTQTGVATGTGYTLSGNTAKFAGKYTAKVTPSGGYCWKDGTVVTKEIIWTINKAANPLTVKAKTKTIKYKTLKKKKQTFGIKNVVTFTKNGQGTVTYVKASGNKGITINKKTGAVTVKKGLKKGTYRVKVRISAAGNANYKKSAAKTVTFTVKVK